MAPRRASTHFEALPAYLGGKRRLAPLIFSLLAEQLPPGGGSDLVFLDPMLGGGAVALHAKALGYRVIASDVAERAVVVARALVANSSVRLRFEDILDLFLEAPRECRQVAAGFVPSVFSAAQAAFLDCAVTRARLRPEPLQSLLLLVITKLALRLQPMSVLDATDAGAAAEGDYDTLSPRRLGHYLRAAELLKPETLWRMAQAVNAGVFGGRGAALKGEARTVIADTTADIVYLDPPYAGTTGYAATYAPLDSLLGDLPQVKTPPPSIDDLLQAAAHIPLLVLSYGGPTITLEELRASVARYRPVLKALAIPYPHLKSLATETTNASNKELLIVAGRR